MFRHTQKQKKKKEQKMSGLYTWLLLETKYLKKKFLLRY